MSRKHKIEKQVLDLELTENEDVYELQSRFRDVYFEVILPAIEKELDEISSDEDVVVIDQLKLDLGEIENLNQIDSNLIQKCVEQIRDQLAVVHTYRTSNIPAENRVENYPNVRVESTKNNRDMSYFRALTFFLENGYLPWKVVSDFSDKHEKSRVMRLIAHVIEHEPQKFYSYVRANVGKTTIQLRLYNHLSKEQIELFLESEKEKIREFTLNGAQMSQLSDDISSIVSSQPLSNESKKAILWSIYVTFATTNVLEKMTPRSILPTLVEFVIREQKVSTNFWEFVLRVAQLSTSHASPILREQLKAIGLTEEVLRTLSDLLQEKTFSNSSVYREKKASLNEWIIKKKNILELRNVVPQFKGDVEELLVKFAKRIVSEDKAEMESYLDSAKDEELMNEPQEKRNIPEEGISIENSGLVILWPYLTTLFDHLEWFDSEGNMLEEALPKALSLTHYLVFGHEEVDESLLPLNKLLLGIDLEDPMTNTYRLTDLEKEEADGLIQAVINNWSAIGNVSVEGFRGSFLVRTGIIYDREEMYQLIVERKAFDILMDKLPWSISIVRLRWMEKLVSVTW